MVYRLTEEPCRRLEMRIQSLPCRLERSMDGRTVSSTMGWGKVSTRVGLGQVETRVGPTSGRYQPMHDENNAGRITSSQFPNACSAARQSVAWMTAFILEQRTCWVVLFAFFEVVARGQNEKYFGRHDGWVLFDVKCYVETKSREQ
jgi:hypothetical protein